MLESTCRGWPRARQYAVVRSLSHKDNNHTAATHHVITGTPQPGVRFDKPLSRDDWPCCAGGVSFLQAAAGEVPAGVTLPTFLREEAAGLAGPARRLPRPAAPWQIDRDPNRRDFRVENLDAAGFDVVSLRVDRRASCSPT
ncbi:MAG: hypothetical protein U0797_20745 [Gemmataceae bacterium]